MEYYFIIPRSKEAKYPPVKDSSGRNITTLHNPCETSLLICVNQRYIKTVTAKWGVEFEKYAVIEPMATSYQSITGDKILINFEDFAGEDIIAFGHNLININETKEMLKKYKLGLAILPQFDGNYDYTQLPAVDNLLWVIPQQIRVASLIKPLIVEGTKAFDTFDETWTKYIMQPVNKFFYPKAQSEAKVYVPAVLDGRPDILLMPIPYNSRLSANTIDAIKAIHYQLAFYISLATSHDILKEEMDNIINRQWIELVGNVVCAGEKGRLENDIEMAANSISNSAETVERDVQKLVLLKSRQRSSDTFSKSKPSMSVEVKMLREWGCTIENSFLVYPVRNIRIKHGGKYRLIGDLDILIDLSRPAASPSVRVSPTYPKKLNSAGYPHPHVAPDGHICLGDISREIPVAMKSHSFSKALMLIGELLQHYNANSPFNRIENWPECDKDGKIIPPNTTPAQSQGGTDAATDF